MFVLDQCVSILSTNLLILRQLSIIRDDKIKINKPNIYYEDRTSLENWLMQVNIYFIFYFILANQKTIFALTFFKERV